MLTLTQRSHGGPGLLLRFQQKLLIPTATHPLVERSALIAQLDQAITSKRVVTLAAPAGWGKTTTLAQWAAQATLPVAWYTLDRTDRDPQLFVDYLLHSLAPFIPGTDELIGQLATTPPQGMPELLSTVALVIADAPRSFVLVLDDFHMLDDDPAAALAGTSQIFELLGALVEYAPNCHLVFASRTLPDRQGLARMVVQQRASIFDYTALQFSAAEVQKLAGPRWLADDHAEQLASQFSGWIAGIVIAIEHIAPEHDTAANGHLIELPQLFDFFAEQVLAPLPPALQRFLEDTSVLDDLSPQRCEALCGTHETAALLAEIRRRVLFVSRRGSWLSLHSLFREFLRARLAQNPAREQPLLRRAGDLYRDEDDIERAISCYLSGAAADAAITLLRNVTPRFLQRSRQITLLTCFDRLSAHMTQAGKHQLLPPDLLLAQARVYRDLALWERAELAIQLAETTGDQATRWECSILSADTLVLQHEHARAQAILAEVPVERLPARLQFSYHITAGRLQLRAGQIDTAIRSLEHAQALTPSIVEIASDPGMLATIADNLGAAYAMRGDRAKALRHLKRADACWQTCGNHGRRTATLNNLGMLALEDGHYGEARLAFTNGLDLARQTARRREEMDLHASLADLELIEGHLAAAITHFRQSYDLAVQMNRTVRIASAATGALWAATLLHDQEAIRSWKPIVAALGTASQQDIRARQALTRGLALLLQPFVELELLATLCAQAGEDPRVLLPVERAALAFLQAAIALAQLGWPGAQPAWETFAGEAAVLPDALIQQFAAIHPLLLATAAPSSAFARRMSDLNASSTSPRWAITALGTFSCRVDGKLCALSSLHRALLIRLLDAGPAGLTVERLWEDVWGQGDISMTAFHSALSRLRSQAQLAIVARDGICAIQSSWSLIDYDVRTLERILDGPMQHDAAQRALACYRGDFLLGEVPSATVWAGARRVYLQQRFLDALDQIARASEADQPEQAMQYYQQILQIDGCREQTAAQLMRLAARFGNRSLMATTYDLLESALRNLDMTPDPSIADLYRRLQ